MYPINVSFKDILRIGTADSSFSLICTGLVHVFLQVFVHSLVIHHSAVPFEHGSMDLSRSPVRSSFRTRVHGPASVTSPQFLSNTDICDSNILANEKYGFRLPPLSIRDSSALINEIIEALNNKNIVDGIFCD